MNTKGVDKGYGMRWLVNYLGYDMDETIGIGDNYNDVEMFERSYYSYAMQHSPSDIRKCAKHITPDVDSILEDILRM